MMDDHRGPAVPRLADIRTRWLDAAVRALRADRSVLGAALVGSLGDGRADDWSDIDLLLVVDDADLDDYAAPDRLPNDAARPSFAIDARHNGPLGTRAVSAQYVVEGLPVWVDWHMHPVSSANWPSDCTVVFDRSGIERTAATFSEYLNRGRHEPAIDNTDHVQALRLALVPAAGKQIARRSPEAGRIIEFLGAPQAADATGEEQLTLLRGLLDEFRALGRHESLAAGYAYLTLVEQALTAHIE